MLTWQLQAGFFLTGCPCTFSQTKKEQEGLNTSSFIYIFEPESEERSDTEEEPTSKSFIIVCQVKSFMSRLRTYKKKEG